MLILGADGGLFVFPAVPELVKRLVRDVAAGSIVIEGGTVPLMEHGCPRLPPVVLAFLVDAD
ncbi:hypothetical protein GCM10017788_37720 [Amycolatopsis acidiphila]|nr:hypothetical protein GCM10017788_37720 [Amycolatopsis acidiphila]